MRFDCITIFPEMFTAISESGITRRAFFEKQAELNLWQLRDFANNSYRTIDDRPYGGGAGMVMLAEPLKAAVIQVKEQQEKAGLADATVIYLSASGTPLTQAKAYELSKKNALTLISGRYEGIDQRFIDSYVDEEISVGDFVVSGGELPAMILMDCIIRLIPGVIDEKSIVEESFSMGQAGDLLLEYPHYTRPEIFEGKKIPNTLLSGHHADIAKWRKKMAQEKTAKKRPDLLHK